MRAQIATVDDLIVSGGIASSQHDPRLVNSTQTVKLLDGGVNELYQCAMRD